jgi:DNA replication protein DnaC
MIQELLEAKKEQKLTAFLKRLDAFDLIVLDELGYVPTDLDGATLLFQLISDRAERKSILITTNLAYSEWKAVFVDSNMTAAAIDRIIFHCDTYTITRDSFRQKEAEKRALGVGKK